MAPRLFFFLSLLLFLYSEDYLLVQLGVNSEALERPLCDIASPKWEQRRVAYYQVSADTRNCDKFKPEDIPIHALTHVNIAFGTIGSDFKIASVDESMIRRITNLKLQNRALKIYVSIGGTDFSTSDSTKSRFSDMVSDQKRSATFVTSAIDLLGKYGLDGIDIDWEYPGAPDRGGKETDYQSFPRLVRGMRDAFNLREPSWGISITIPPTNGYLKNFDLESLQKDVNWFNLMSDDIHGKGGDEESLKSMDVVGKSNTTDIQIALDLILRSKIDLKKVNLGVGFYGRTYTLVDPHCVDPGCKFSDPGLPGDCSNKAGLLTFREIRKASRRLNKHEYNYDQSHGSVWMVYDDDQWISYDDTLSFVDKQNFMTIQCLGGVAIWTIDQDTEDFSALSGLLGDGFVTDALIEGGTQSSDEKKALALQLSGLSGDGCYITLGCSGPNGATDSFGACNEGWIPTERLHQPGGSYINNYGLKSHEALVCNTTQWHTVCCRKESPAQNCIWRGAPVAGSMDCSGGLGNTTCGNNQFELATDTFTSAEGDTRCAKGVRSLCCDSIPEVQKCRWTGCSKTEDCDLTGSEERVAVRGDLDGGAPCPDGQYRSYCCPKPSLSAGGPRADRYKDCSWKPTVPVVAQTSNQPLLASLPDCNTNLTCSDTQITMTKARIPDRYPPQAAYCQWQAPGLEHRLCCDPPRNVELPFNPVDLFSDAHGGDDLYMYKDDYGNNDKDPHGPEEQDYGDDPYGFILLDGAEDALQGSFPRNFIFVHDDDGSDHPIKQRDTFMSNDPLTMGSTFDQEETWHYIYCHKGRETHCDQVFLDGAQDTIIAIPRHIGSGPYARIVSMEQVDHSLLPDYHIGRRALQQEHSTVYKLVFDYSFDLIKRQTPVNIRVDYTNMVNYWDTMTGIKSGKGSGVSRRHEKRFWGEFKEWLKKLSAVELSDMGKLPMQIKREILLYRYRVGCPRGKSVLRAGLDITLNTDLDMNARWAYYVSGTIVPLNIHRTYAYFGVQPSAQMTLEMKGSAEMRYNSKRIKVIDTLAWPGLAIKGIASIGPTLDLWAEMRSQITISGEMRAGAKVEFPQYEIFFPQNDESEEFQKWVTPNQNQEQEAGVAPILDASVTAQVALDLLITPEVNLGISVGLKSGQKAVDAQIVAFVNNTLSFNIEAQASGTIENGGSAQASYKIWVDYFYNFGIGGRATFISIIKSALQPKTLWPGKGRKIRLWEHQDSISTSTAPRSLPAFTYWNDSSGEPMNENTNWYRNEEANFESSGPLSKRLSFADISSFGKGLLTCNDGKQCKSGKCAACQIGASPQSKKRDGGDTSAGADDDPPCVTEIPAVMYNCKYFPDEERTLPDGTKKHFTGICSNIMNYFDNEGLGSGPKQLSLNWVPGETEHRRKTCGKTNRIVKLDDKGNAQLVSETMAETCQRESDELSALLKLPAIIHGNSNWMSCDEFPFNSVEEGGAGAVMACVPGYQQEIQSTINGLFKQISHNIPVAGVDTWRDYRDIWDPNDKEGAWNVGGANKKSFTFHLFSSSPTTGQTSNNPIYEIFNHKLVSDPPKSKLVTDISKVIGAINLGGNPSYKVIGFNARCDMGLSPRRSASWGNYVRAKSCNVNFETPEAVSKRKREEPDSESQPRITGVEPILEDAPEEWIQVDNSLLDDSREDRELDGQTSPNEPSPVVAERQRWKERRHKYMATHQGSSG